MSQIRQEVERYHAGASRPGYKLLGEGRMLTVRGFPRRVRPRPRHHGHGAGVGHRDRPAPLHSGGHAGLTVGTRASPGFQAGFDASTEIPPTDLLAAVGARTVRRRTCIRRRTSLRCLHARARHALPDPRGDVRVLHRADGLDRMRTGEAMSLDRGHVTCTADC